MTAPTDAERLAAYLLKAIEDMRRVDHVSVLLGFHTVEEIADLLCCQSADLATAETERDDARWRRQSQARG